MALVHTAAVREEEKRLLYFTRTVQLHDSALPSAAPSAVSVTVLCVTLSARGPAGRHQGGCRAPQQWWQHPGQLGRVGAAPPGGALPGSTLSHPAGAQQGEAWRGPSHCVGRRRPAFSNSLAAAGEAAGIGSASA